MNALSIPTELIALPNWVMWKYVKKSETDKPTKIPFVTTGTPAKSTDPATWCGFNEAMLALEKSNGIFPGIGFVITPPYCGIDLDDCLDDAGNPYPKARKLIDLLASYCDVSPSGKGVKIIVKARKPGGKCTKEVEWAENVTGQIEIYDSKRFFTITGNVFPNTTPTVEPRQRQIDLLYKRLWPPDVSAYERCQKYLDKCPDSISGQGGHDKALRAACECMRFGLSDSETLNIMRWWSANKSGDEPWDEREIAHKIASAREKVTADGEIGTRLNSETSKSKKGEKVVVRPSDTQRLLTDVGNAARFARQHEELIRWCPPQKEWLVWTGTHWSNDESETVTQAGIDTVLAIASETQNATNESDRVAISKHYSNSQKRDRIAAAIALAKPAMVLPVALLDTNPWAFNCANGTINLKTGELHPHSREDYITKIAPVEFDHHAQSPLWLAFLTRIMDGNNDLISFLQRAIGYCLTGIVSERCFFIPHGPGANGKSVFLETIGTLLGDYSATTPASTLLATRNEERPRNDIAALAGVRFVSASEINESRKLDEAIVKTITGDERISARFLFHEPFRFLPAFKVWLATNHRPEISGTDNAIWDRIKLIPFRVVIPETQRDLKLKEKLRAELPGILNWAIAGCLAWQTSGLNAPTEVRQATADYRAEEDTIGAFIDECCIVSDGLSVASATIYQTYLDWCKTSAIEPLTQTAFGRKLSDRGFRSDKTAKPVRRTGLTIRAKMDSIPI